MQSMHAIQKNSRKKQKRSLVKTELVSPHCNYRFLHPHQWQIRYDLLKEDMTNIIKKFPLLQKATDSMIELEKNENNEKEQILISNETSDLINKFMNDIRTSTKHSILREMIVSCLQSDDEFDDIQNTEIDEFSSFLIQQMTNFKLKHSPNKEKGIRYSSQIIRLALSVWSRTKAGYNEIQKHSTFLCLPTPRHLRKLKKKMQIREGFNPTIYQRLDMALNQTNECRIGQLLFDELKLKKQLLINTKSNEVIGLVSDSGKIEDVLKDDMKNLIGYNKSNTSNNKSKKDDSNLDDDEKDMSDVGIATYVNLFRFRNLFNQCYNLEYYYSDGTMSSDDVFSQIQHCLLMSAMIDVKIVALVSDAGGANSGLHKLLRKGKKLPTNVSWISEEYFYFNHPCYLNEKVFFGTVPPIA